MTATSKQKTNSQNMYPAKLCPYRVTFKDRIGRKDLRYFVNLKNAHIWISIMASCGATNMVLHYRRKNKNRKKITMTKRRIDTIRMKALR